MRSWARARRMARSREAAARTASEAADEARASARATIRRRRCTQRWTLRHRMRAGRSKQQSTRPPTRRVCELRSSPHVRLGAERAVRPQRAREPDAERGQRVERGVGLCGRSLDEHERRVGAPPQAAPRVDDALAGTRDAMSMRDEARRVWSAPHAEPTQYLSSSGTTSTVHACDSLAGCVYVREHRPQ
jgi:hypothetical protein